MSDENDAASKTEEPTPRRLEQARAKGDVAKTPELPQLMSLAGAAAVVIAMGGHYCNTLATALLPFIAHPDAIPLDGHGGLAVMHQVVGVVLPIILTVLLAAGAAGAAGHLAQTGLMFTPDKLAPDWSKLSPMQGLKRMFGLDALIQFARSLIKLAVIGVLAFLMLKNDFRGLQTLATLEPAAILPLCAEILKKLVFAVLAFTVVIAGADWMIQRQRFMARMRMSREEMKEEHKNNEGDPHVKARQRQLRMERARRRMMQAVPSATVVITNPTHYAVALKYVQGEDDAPVCVAKGVDAIALKIREVAGEHNVPIIEDPPLARALYAAVEIDEIIPAAHYQAVAKVIGFVLSAARRRRRPTHRPL